MQLTGRHAFVTGPAKGMGAAVTLSLAAEGADLVLAGRDLDAIQPVAEKVREMGRRATVISCDVTNPDSVTQASASAMAAFDGRLDILVNVAGGTGTLGKPFWENTPEEFEQICG